MDKPFLYPFAKDGDRNTELPNANATDSSVSFQSGFTLPYELNPANGGKNLERKDMNEILFRICDAINNISQEVDKWIPLTTENLNEVKNKGRYFQATQSQATNVNNYPTNKTGYLIVFDSINGNISQFYKVANSNVFYARYKNNNAWSNWDIFAPVIQRRWVNELANRFENTIYTNTKPYEIVVCVTLNGGEIEQYVYVDDILISRVYDGNNAIVPITFVVPPNSTYKIQIAVVTGYPIYGWSEYK